MTQAGNGDCPAALQIVPAGHGGDRNVGQHALAEKAQAIKHDQQHGRTGERAHGQTDSAKADNHGAGHQIEPRPVGQFAEPQQGDCAGQRRRHVKTAKIAMTEIELGADFAGK